MLWLGLGGLLLLIAIWWKLWVIDWRLGEVARLMERAYKRHACVVCGKACNCGGDELTCTGHYATVVNDDCQAKLAKRITRPVTGVE